MIAKEKISLYYYSSDRLENNIEWFNNKIWNIDNVKFNFNNYKAYPEIEYCIKNYLLYEYITNSINSVNRTFSGINFFIRFLILKYPMIKSFNQVNELVINTYFDYVLNFKSLAGSTEYNENGNKLSATSIFHNTKFLYKLFNESISKGLIKKPIEFANYIEKVYKQMILNNPYFKKKSKIRTTKKEYSQEKIKEIITKAYCDEDLYIRAIIIIQSQCGLRIGEVYQ